MAEYPRLNKIIGALENGGYAFCPFATPNIDSAMALTDDPYDGIVFEMEHNPWDAIVLRDCLQYMLNRAAIANSGSIAPSVTPMVRVPPNGNEMAQWHAKQALDLGFYGIVFPHISSVEEAYNAVGACRYPRLPDQPLYEPKGIRGDGANRPARYWGLPQQDYYKKADVWPLDPEGEVLVVLMIEDSAGIDCLDEMLKTVPGIGVILIGEGDLSQELGYPRQYDHPVVVDAMDQIVGTCKKHDVPVGHPHIGLGNIEWAVEKGFRFLMVKPERTLKGLEKGMELAGRT